MANFPNREKTVGLIKTAQAALKKRLFTYIGAGLGLVAGLAWNDAISALIKFFVPEGGNSVIAKFVYAFILTVVVALVLYYIERALTEPEQK
jgi:hypothetical protein